MYTYTKLARDISYREINKFIRQMNIRIEKMRQSNVLLMFYLLIDI